MCIYIYTYFYTHICKSPKWQKNDLVSGDHGRAAKLGACVNWVEWLRTSANKRMWSGRRAVVMMRWAAVGCGCSALIRRFLRTSDWGAGHEGYPPPDCSGQGKEALLLGFSICAYVCICMRMYMCVHVCVYSACVYVCICIYVCLCTCMHIHIYARACWRTYALV